MIWHCVGSTFIGGSCYVQNLTKVLLGDRSQGKREQNRMPVLGEAAPSQCPNSRSSSSACPSSVRFCMDGQGLSQVFFFFFLLFLGDLIYLQLYPLSLCHRFPDLQPCLSLKLYSAQLINQQTSPSDTQTQLFQNHTHSFIAQVSLFPYPGKCHHSPLHTKGKNQHTVLNSNIPHV